MSKLFAKVISKRKSPLAGKELKELLNYILYCIIHLALPNNQCMMSGHFNAKTIEANRLLLL